VSGTNFPGFGVPAGGGGKKIKKSKPGEDTLNQFPQTTQPNRRKNGKRMLGKAEGGGRDTPMGDREKKRVPGGGRTNALGVQKRARENKKKSLLWGQPTQLWKRTGAEAQRDTKNAFQGKTKNLGENATKQNAHRSGINHFSQKVDNKKDLYRGGGGAPQKQTFFSKQKSFEGGGVFGQKKKLPNQPGTGSRGGPEMRRTIEVTGWNLKYRSKGRAKTKKFTCCPSTKTTRWDPTKKVEKRCKTT